MVIHEIDDMTLTLSLIGESDAVRTIPLFQPSPVSPTSAVRDDAARLFFLSSLRNVFFFFFLDS